MISTISTSSGLKSCELALSNAVVREKQSELVTGDGAARLGFNSSHRLQYMILRGLRKLAQDCDDMSPHSQESALRGIQPVHVIAHAVFERKSWLVAECAAGIREIGLGEVLVMRVRVIDVIRLKICVETFVKNGD